MWDVLIAGAGPAGSVAAHVLARKGRRVLMVDAVARRAVKVGETLPGAALRLLRALNLPIPKGERPHTQIGGTLSSWGSEDLIAEDFFCSPDGPGWRLDRLRFDAALRESATCSGATFRKSRVREADREGQVWRIKLDDGELVSSRWLIDATGRSASQARKFGAKWLRDVPLTALYGIGQPQREFQMNRTMVEAAPQGWWYVALLPSGSPIVGLHVLPTSVRQFWGSPLAWKEALMQTRHVCAQFRDVRFDYPLHALDASGGRLNCFTGDGWLACGDAAMSFDPISSQGMLSALYSGMMAGMTIDETLTGGVGSLKAYSARLEETRRIYLLRCRSVYRSQTRWSTNIFWKQVRQGC